MNGNGDVLTIFTFALLVVLYISFCTRTPKL